MASRWKQYCQTCHHVAVGAFLRNWILWQKNVWACCFWAKELPIINQHLLLLPYSNFQLLTIIADIPYDGNCEASIVGYYIIIHCWHKSHNNHQFDSIWDCLAPKVGTEARKAKFSAQRHQGAVQDVAIQKSLRKLACFMCGISIGIWNWINYE